MSTDVYNICHPCGLRYGTATSSRAVGCWQAVCDVCGKLTSCCAPRDYGHLQHDWEAKYREDVKKGIQPW